MGRCRGFGAAEGRLGMNRGFGGAFFLLVLVFLVFEGGKGGFW